MRETVEKNPDNSSASRRPSRKRDRIKEFAEKCKQMVTTKKQDEIMQQPPSNEQETESKEESTAVADSPVPEMDLKFECRPPICLIPLKEHTDIGLSFSGCGFLSVYHFGVVKCFLRNGKSLVSRCRRMSGASAGSLVAAMLVLAPEKLEESMETMCLMGDELNSMKFGALTPGYYLGERLVKIVDEFIPQDISKANHRLFISVTHHKTRENRLISVYPSREYLISCLNASCYIPMYSMGVSASPPEIDGQGYIDGGYTNNLPDYSDLRTVTVSPFSSRCDISPTDEVGFDWKMTLGNQHMKVNLRNIVRGAQSLFPPSRATLKHYYDQGYRDAFKFLLDNDMLERDSGSSV